MALTNAQRNTLKAYILADPVLSTKVSGPGTDRAFIADALSATASPAQKAWRTNVPAAEADDAPNYANFDSILPGKRESWGFFLRYPRDFTRNKTRKWVTDIWGNATAGSDAEAILQAGTENARLCEVVIGGSTKTTGTVSALDRTYIGIVTIDDVAEMFA